jgi:diguanylate cyclase (GGDEF)-like protein/PAS domain S-box-containing protein
MSAVLSAVDTAPLDALVSARASALLEHVLAHAPVTLYLSRPGPGFALFFVSPSVAELLGYAPHDLLGQPDFWVNNIHPEDLDLVLADRRALVPGEVWLRKYRVRCANGQWKWIRDRARLEGVPGHQEIFGAWNDITELIDAEESLRLSEAKHRFLLDNINAGVLVFSAQDTRIVYSNKQAEALMGCSAQALRDMAPQILRDALVNEDGSALAREEWPVGLVVRERRLLQNRMLGLRRSAGDEPVWLIVNAFPDINSQGRVREVVVTLLDITERVCTQRQIHRLAHYDALTDLPNRTLINLQIDRAIESARTTGGQVALLFLDLNDFKIINDSLGHAFGDQILRQVAELLSRSVRESDTVGRIGGDEFIIVLPAAGPDAAARVARKIGEQMNAPFEVEGQSLPLQASIGISVYPDDGADRAALTRNADAAMYHAKACGNGHQFFDAGIFSRLEKHHALEQELGTALEQGQFALHYQPQIELRSGRLIGVEALIRWHHPVRGMVAPLDFIDVAEKSGLIQPIGKWIIAQACRDIRHWAGQGLAHVRVALNLSLRQLQEQNFLAHFLAIVEASGVPHDCLEWEITESTMMRNPEVVLGFMRSCRERGIRFAIDDFGTGHSSLGLLNNLPVDKIKIDKSFVDGIAREGSVQVILASVIGMARRLGLSVVAEGVEEREQLEFLQQINCDAVQGYYFSRPLERDALASFVQGESGRLAQAVPRFNRWATLGGDGSLRFAV